MVCVIICVSQAGLNPLTCDAENLEVLSLRGNTHHKRIVIADVGDAYCAWVLVLDGSVGESDYKPIIKGPECRSVAETLEGLLQATSEMVRARFELKFEAFSREASMEYGGGGMALGEKMA